MPQPMICLDQDMCHVAERFRAQFSKPHYQYVVTVLLGLMECEGRHALSALLRAVGHAPSVSGLSRLLSEAPWSQEAVVADGWEHVRAEMQPLGTREREQQRKQQPKRRGRPKDPLVTGYLIGDDSTMRKPKGRTMEGLGTHHSTTYDQRIVGHSLVQGRDVLLDRTCPLAPQVSRQEKVCEAEQTPFQSTIDLMKTLIGEFEPVADTHTHILLESWSCATCVWHAARERDVLITTGRKSNRWLRIADETAPQGWRWQRLSEDVAGVSAQDVELLCWPRGGKKVSVHVVIVRHDLAAPLAQTRCWASSDVEADAQQLLMHIAARWDSEVFFGDGKEELGLDQYHVRSASSLLRLWTLAMLASVFLEEEQQRLRLVWQRPVSIGEARREIQRRHRRCLFAWLHGQFLSGVHPETLFEIFAASCGSATKCKDRA